MPVPVDPFRKMKCTILEDAASGHSKGASVSVQVLKEGTVEMLKTALLEAAPIEDSMQYVMLEHRYAQPKALKPLPKALRP